MMHLSGEINGSLQVFTDNTRRAERDFMSNHTHQIVVGAQEVK